MFLSNPGIVPVPKVTDMGYLDGPLIYQSATDRITIPLGFLTDQASTPKVFDWIPFLDRQGFSRRAGALHDGIYCLGRNRGKDFADGILSEALIAEGMTIRQAQVYFEAVQCFAQSAWDSDAATADVPSMHFWSDASYEVFRVSGSNIYS